MILLYIQPCHDPIHYVDHEPKNPRYHPTQHQAGVLIARQEEDTLRALVLRVQNTPTLSHQDSNNNSTLRMREGTAFAP